MLNPPNSETRILLHCCCAPCSGGIINEMLDSGICLTIIFYNPNIHPQKEYERRKGSISAFAEKNGIPFFDLDYDPENWLLQTKGLEDEPEKGKRCSKCFDMRLEKTALFAKENGFKVFATTIGISRWKDIEQVNMCGRQAASRHPGLIFWDHNWRNNAGQFHMYETAKKEHFYKQKYCGCKFSLEAKNKFLTERGEKTLPDDPQYY